MSKHLVRRMISVFVVALALAGWSPSGAAAAPGGSSTCTLLAPDPTEGADARATALRAGVRTARTGDMGAARDAFIWVNQSAGSIVDARAAAAKNNLACLDLVKQQSSSRGALLRPEVQEVRCASDIRRVRARFNDLAHDRLVADLTRVVQQNRTLVNSMSIDAASGACPLPPTFGYATFRVEDGLAPDGMATRLVRIRDYLMGEQQHETVRVFIENTLVGTAEVIGLAELTSGGVDVRLPPFGSYKLRVEVISRVEGGVTGRYVTVAGAELRVENGQIVYSEPVRPYRMSVSAGVFRLYGSVDERGRPAGNGVWLGPDWSNLTAETRSLPMA